MAEDGFDPFEGDARHLTLQRWTALRQSTVARAREKRHRAIRHMVAGTFRLIRGVWRRIRIREEARAALNSMTDRELRDMGISRLGIEAAIWCHNKDISILPRG
jgi:uncharacterized protein YjiS (DUF1127 family)